MHADELLKWLQMNAGGLRPRADPPLARTKLLVSTRDEEL
jgi:hypothetical protein